MSLDISSIVTCENKSVTEEVQIELDTFKSRMGDFLITEKSPVELKITNQENKRLLIQGTVDFTALIPCGRCLEEVPTKIHFDIEKKLPINGAEVSEEEMDESDYLIGFDLDVDRLIYEEILVNWPMKVLCNEDCKGICKVCGINLNKGDCNCQRTELDPRMAAFQDVFNKFKEV